MGSALNAGVSGLKAHEMMLDVAGNNIANVNTNAYKSNRVTFAELLSSTVAKATGPSANLGGVNPQQLGTGVGVAGMSRDMNQGNIVSTGQDLDMAISGEGYFTLSDGSQDVYTRIGAFSIDSDGALVDTATGYRVQRTGTVGESDGFQASGNGNIYIPFDAALPAKKTSEVTMTGNLRATATGEEVAQVTTAGSAFTNQSTGELATGTTTIDDIVTGGPLGAGASMTITATDADGTAVVATTNIATGDTLNTILADMSTNFSGAALTIVDGKITLTDSTGGYSSSGITSITYTASGAGETLTMPSYYKLTTAGGNDSARYAVTVYDELGGSHVMNCAFVKTDTANTWDMAIESIDGEVGNPGTTDRWIRGIQFNDDGSYAGLSSAAEPLTLEVRWSHDPTDTQTITFDLGTEGKFDGITQFASATGKSSTVTAKLQDGYSFGKLTSVSVTSDGKIVGQFTNGERKDLATLQISMFQNPAGMEAIGEGYYYASDNSGVPIDTEAMNNGAGSIQGKSLEKSNVDLASEFVSLIEAQNGYQANARTISVANDVMRELSNLIR